MTTMKWPRAFACAAMLCSCGGGGAGSSAAPPPAPGAVIVERPWSTVLSANQTHTVVGNVSIIDNFPIPQLNKTRRIWIYLPADYSLSNARYPVLYMNDGQNIFDTATSYAGEWGVDESMLAMEKDDAGLRAIVVGIDNGGTARADEYLPSGHAKQYVDFIVQTLKPYIDSHYRTKPDRDHTAIGGSSYGAYVSLYAGFTHQDVFGMVAAFSNVSLYDGGRLQDILHQAGHQQDMRIYLDAGRLEEAQFAGIIASDQQIYNSLLAAGFGAPQLRIVIDPLGSHNEAAWRRRFPDAWKWLDSATTVTP
jgi:predicted alpha/beta superfamily hydrolase